MARRFLQIGERRVDLETGAVDDLGVLRPLERSMLRYLAEHPDRAVSVHELHAEVWGYAAGTISRAAYTTAQRLRPLIEPDPHRPRFLLAERGDGYRLVGFRWEDDGDLVAVDAGLPAERDRFVGRAADLARLEAFDQSGARSISITGMGGSGKSRTALRFAHTRSGRAWFCDLTAVRTPDEIGQAVLQALGHTVTHPRPIEAAAEAVAAAGPGWWVLDNFEHLVGWAEPTVGRWLDAAPRSRFLVTTRERLGLVGEHVLALEPLTPADARELLEARVRALRPAFDVNPDDDAVVDELLALLDRLPLAIELVAPRLLVLPVRDVLARLSDRFALLVTGGRRAERHSTLRAVLDGSWELLDDALRDALSQLSIFEGGFDLPAAEAVLHLPDVPVLDAVQALVDRSLVVPVDADGRFSLLVSVAAYASERLAERGGQDSAERRHEAWFLRGDAVQGPAEMPNRVAACRRVIARGDADAAAAALAMTAWRLLDTGHCSVPLALAHEVLAMPGLGPTGRGTTCAVLGGVHIIAGDHDRARPLLDEALALARADGDRGRIGRTLGRRAFASARAGKAAEAEADLHAALRELDSPADRVVVLGNLGSVVMDRDPAEAERLLLEALELHEMLGRTMGASIVIGNIGLAHLRRGQLDEAEVWLRRSVAASRSTGHRRAETTACLNLGDLALTRGRLDDAEEACRQALALSRRTGDRAGSADAQIGLAEVARARGDQDAVRHHLDAAASLAPDAKTRERVRTGWERLG